MYVKDVEKRVEVGEIGEKLVLLGWVKNKRESKGIIFIDICDSTGCIQVVIEKINVLTEHFVLAKKISCESAVKITGILVNTDKSIHHSREISVRNLELIGLATISIYPQPRNKINIFDPKLQEHLMNYRHFYLRNEKMMAILRFRHLLMGIIHQWFRDNGYIEITAPVLTPTPLYDDRSAISLEIQSQKIFLTQCVGFYLESAVHAFKKVYNIGPSFRGEESKSKRHLMEYWHIKAEVAFGDLDDIISIVENLISYITKRCCNEGQNLAKVIGTTVCNDGLVIPFPRISYSEAVLILQQKGFDFEFGKSLGSDEEAILSLNFQQPFWVTGIPRSIEPFPYVIDSSDTRVTKTADLIATKGYGELLGVAEKIHDPIMLDERMREKNKLGYNQYEWLRELRQYGCVPHIGFGLGVERLIRWLIDIPHVRDTIPFFRTFGRKIHP